MTPITSNRFSPHIILLLLSLSWIQCIHGFTDIIGGVGVSSPCVSALSYRIDRCNGCSNEKVEVHDEQSTRSAPNNDRRSFLSQVAASSLAVGSPLLYPTQNANALPFIWGPDRRQLELCLVTILRTEYWAINTARSLKSKLLSPTINTNGDSTDTINSEPVLSESLRKQPYLEARLGAKALLTRKVGGGANSRVMELGGLQLKECLDDARYWCGELAESNQLPSQQTGELSIQNAKRMCSNDLSTTAEELLESLASIVEFDGLETTIDPSPRSSLMLSMYTPQKGAFVYRTLVERVVPSCERFSKFFGKEKMRVVEEFVRRDYGNEIPFEVLEKMYGSQQE